MKKHIVQWHSAAPLWDRILAQPQATWLPRLRQPVLLRFARDDFMEQLAGQLTDDPAGLADYLVRPESWRQPNVGWLPPDDSSLQQPVKLFQPVHGRFYLVAVSLVCRAAGLPERTVQTAAEERVSFVVRRLVDGTEHAWIGDRQQGQWQPVAGDTLAPGEEQLGLFPVAFRQDDRSRRLLAGLIPVAGREVYESAVSPPPPADDQLDGDPLADPRQAAFGQRVIDPLASLEDFPVPADGLTAEDRRQAREVLAFALLELAQLLDEHLGEVWTALDDGSAAGLADADQDLYNRLNRNFGTPLSVTWRQLLLEVHGLTPDLLTREFADLEPDLTFGEVSVTDLQTAVADWLGNQTTGLFARLQAALAARPLNSPAPAPIPEEEEQGAGGVYVIRCLYQRPRCRPFVDPLVSVPSRPFRLASYFDPDAPVRPLKIKMPLDTSLKGLRAFPKGVSVELSKKLRQQLDRAQRAGMQGLTDQNLGQTPSLDLGMICSFSIPIITICALILLMIIVQLLNIVFWWLPLFRICFPVRR